MSTAQEVRLVVKYFGPLLRKREGAAKMMQEIVTGRSEAAARALPVATKTAKTRVDNSNEAQQQQQQTKRAYSTEARQPQRDRAFVELSTTGSLTAEELERFWVTSA